MKEEELKQDVFAQQPGILASSRRELHLQLGSNFDEGYSLKPCRFLQPLRTYNGAFQVGRRESPLEDAEAVLAIRRAVGPEMVLRADANRKWSLDQAILFLQRVQAADLQVRKHLHLEKDRLACKIHLGT